MRLMRFEVPDGALRATYAVPLPEGMAPSDAVPVGESGGAAVFRDAAGARFTLFKTESSIQKRPFAGRLDAVGGVGLTERAGEVALAAGLTAADFAGRTPSGRTGFTVADVEKIIADKES